MVPELQPQIAAEPGRWRCHLPRAERGRLGRAIQAIQGGPQEQERPDDRQQNRQLIDERPLGQSPIAAHDLWPLRHKENRRDRAEPEDNDDAIELRNRVFIVLVGRNRWHEPLRANERGQRRDEGRQRDNGQSPGDASDRAQSQSAVASAASTAVRIASCIDSPARSGRKRPSDVPKLPRSGLVPRRAAG